MVTDPIRLRPGAPGDIPFVMRTWLDSYRHSAWARQLGELYYPTHRLIVEAILKRGRLLVACAAADEDTIAGWACTEADVIHFVFVKPDCRGAGLARRLLEPVLPRGGAASHEIPMRQARGAPRGTFLRALPASWIYDPRAMFERYNQKKESNETLPR